MNDMNPSPETNEERLLDLMIQRATTGITDIEQQELDRLASDSNNLNEPERFEAVAAAVDVAATDPTALPDELRDQILISAGDFFSDQKDSKLVQPVQREEGISKGISRREAFAFAVTAACITLMLTGLNPFAENVGTKVGNGTTTVVPVAKRFDDFVKSNPNDLVDVAWTPVHNDKAKGKVVWSDSQQEGFMVFSGMKVNDPLKEQYQLWIFDTDPGQAAPIDGGVFDIVAGEEDGDGNFIVPIKAHVPVDRAVQFAVTVERPGGVYVSKRENIPVLAQIAGLQ
jgi:hypothetical protein